MSAYNSAPLRCPTSYFISQTRFDSGATLEDLRYYCLTKVQMPYKRGPGVSTVHQITGSNHFCQASYVQYLYPDHLVTAITAIVTTIYT